MSKVLIPFSGGVNSTYALHRFLSETSHDIIAIYAKESWVNKPRDPWRQSRETRIANAKVDWLKSNVRDFTFEIKSVWRVVFEDLRPIRAGFSNTLDYGILHARYQGYSKIIDEYTPDIFVPGVSLENTCIDQIPLFHNYFSRDGMQVIFGGSRTLDPIEYPIDWDAVSATLSGRFEQLESIPAELHAISDVECDCDIAENMKWSCIICGYVGVRKAQPDLSGAELDDIFAKHGSYGKYRNEADPKTYEYRGHPYTKFGELMDEPMSYPLWKEGYADDTWGPEVVIDENGERVE